ncbi:MAG: DUF1848 domain-containing protein [Alphaproteobacteria bacterium]|nr:DUF1848 domain-containing protein [Alphaproteobacteria bacterium]
MIVSASYRTDIPAFYGRWFSRRLAEGSCRVRNPYGGADYQVALDPRSAEAFVFWTRNARPFLPVLQQLAEGGRPFVIQYTLTGYPAVLEPSVPPVEHSVALMRELAHRFGPKVVVWRYDPILDSAATRLADHSPRVAALARALEGATDEVTMSFAAPYRKTARNLAGASVTWRDPGRSAKAGLLGALGPVVARHGMRLTVCTQPDLVTAECLTARCIDAARLGEVAGYAIAAPQKGNRPGCLCAASRDIGAYDTCAQGCVYCYAVDSHERSQANVAVHDDVVPSLAPAAAMERRESVRPANAR